MGESLVEEFLGKETTSSSHGTLREMTMHCGRSDGYRMIIAVGSGFKGGSGQKKEHNSPHAHIW